MNSSKHYNVFIVETNKMYSFLINYKLQRSTSFEITSYSSGGQCVQNLHRKPTVIVLDYKLLGNGTIRILNLIKERSRKSSVIIILEQEDQTILQELSKEGNYDFLVKDKDSTKLADMLIQRIMNSIARREFKDLQFKRKLIGVLITGILVVILCIFSLKFKSGR